MMLNAATNTGPYKNVAPHGAGGMGEVYRARDTRLNLRSMVRALAVGTLFVESAAAAGPKGEPSVGSIQRKTCLAPDGVSLVYSTTGTGDIGLMFIHGGLADRSFYDAQLRALADRYHVVALDLAGHGESGSNRAKWGIPEFGADVKAVIEAEGIKRVILFGNSLGGPVAIEAAMLVPDRVIGVVGIDTFQSLDYSMTSDEARQRAEAFRADYAGSVKGMVKMLFRADADPALVADAEKRMQKTPAHAAHAMFLSMAGYSPAASARKLAVPLQAINGDLYQTDVESVRKVKPDFDVVVMKHMGHYPMLERPDEFNRHVDDIVREIAHGIHAP